MHLFRQQFIGFFYISFLFILFVHHYRINAEQNHLNEMNNVEGHNSNAVRLKILKEMLNRRSVYDPAFDDSWSKYFERKRNLFDPAYSDWANSFKRSDQ